MPNVSEVCFVYCIGDNCSSPDCRNNPDNTPFRINNTVNGTTYTVNISLGNDFGQSGQTTALYGECIKQFLLQKYCVLFSRLIVEPFDNHEHNKYVRSQ